MLRAGMSSAAQFAKHDRVPGDAESAMTPRIRSVFHSPGETRVDEMQKTLLTIAALAENAPRSYDVMVVVA